MKRSTPDKLRRLYDRFASDDHVLIVINADPDAIASAMAVKRLLWRKVAGVSIGSINVIKRPDNLAMIRLLGANIAHVANLDRSRHGRFVMVDSQPCHNDVFSQFAFDVIIDHHPDSGVSAPFRDIRPKYGATATIMTEYLRAAKIKPSAKLATGLFHGIKSDTNNFARQAMIEDVRAFQFLFRHANIHLARRIEQAELRLDFLKYYKLALANMRMRRGRMFVHLGSVANPDICVLIADFFMRVISVNWSIVSGIYNDKLIVVFRNDGLRKDAGKVASQSFGHLGSAGGHKSMSRAELALEKLTGLVDPDDDRLISRWILQSIEQKAGKK